MGDFEISMSASSFGMNYSLRDSFSIKMSELVEQMNIIESDWPILTSGDGVFIVIDRPTRRGC
jgi:hypothetical protein